MNARLPLPISHARAPRVVALKTALLMTLLALEVGFFAGAIGFGLYLL
jgi:hypothetical protein